VIQLFIMARKPKGNQKMNERITFYLSQELLSALNEARYDLRQERSDLIRDALIEYLSRKLPNDLKGKSPYKEALKQKE